MSVQGFSGQISNDFREWNPPSLEQVSNDMVEAGARTRDANKKGRSIYPDGQKENFE